MNFCNLIPLLDRLFQRLGLYSVPGLSSILGGFLEALYVNAGCDE